MLGGSRILAYVPPRPLEQAPGVELPAPGPHAGCFVIVEGKFWRFAVSHVLDGCECVAFGLP